MTAPPGWPPRSRLLAAAGVRPSPAGSEPGESAQNRWMGRAALLVAAVGPLVQAALILAAQPHMTLYGDQALISMDARRAARFDQLLGPYSVQGFHHPGPAVFYVLAPFTGLLSSVGAGLYLGATVFNGATLTAVVALIRHRFGGARALWAAVAAAVWMLFVGVGTMREPWNPYLIIAPMVLFVALWALSVADPAARGAGVWAAVVGSYEVQTHVGTLPVVAVLLMGALGVAWRRKQSRKRSRKQKRSLPRVTRTGALGGLLLVAMWVPSVVELWSDQPNNLALMWDYLRSGRRPAGIPAALRAGSAALGVMPFGNHDYVLTLHRGVAAETATGVILIVAAAVCIRAAHRRGQRVARELAVGGAAVAVIGTLSLGWAPRPLLAYYGEWLAVVPLILLLAGGLVVGPLIRPTSRSRPLSTDPLAPAAAAIATAVAVSVMTVAQLRAIPISSTTGSGPWPTLEAATTAGRRATVSETAVLDAAARRATVGSTPVGLVIAQPGLWPYAAGIALTLEEAGVRVVVPPSWRLYFGPHEAGTTASGPTLILTAPGGNSTGPGRVIARTPAADLSLVAGKGGLRRNP